MDSRVEQVRAHQEQHVDSLKLNTHTPPMKVDVNLVLAPVTITDHMDRLMTGFDKDNFQVFDGKEKQAIQHFGIIRVCRDSE